MEIIGRKALSNTLPHILHFGHAGVKSEGVKVVSDIYEESKDTTRYRWVFISKQKLPFSETAFGMPSKGYANVCMCMYLCICVLYIQTCFSRKRIMQGSLNLISCLFCIHKKTKNKLRSNSSLFD